LSITGETNTEIDELSARFIRDAVPLADQLYHVARRHTCNHADAEDLVQDVMMRAYRNFDQFTDGTNIKGWLLRIMTNSRITGYRTATRRPPEFLSDDVDGAQRSAGAARLSVVSPSGCAAGHRHVPALARPASPAGSARQQGRSQRLSAESTVLNPVKRIRDGVLRRGPPGCGANHHAFALHH
jgi:RNA polymerase sigma factor (sigma-70 family)